MKKQALVITSIHAPNAALKKFAAECKKNDVAFFLIGDAKSPTDFQLADCDYWSMARQSQLPFALSRSLPKNSYARKNLGYLLAMQAGCDIIMESDDDNFPNDTFFADKQLMQEAHSLHDQGWVNIYKYFTHENIWPRGLPLNYVKKNVPALSTLEKKQLPCPIQQGLADENPDVDAIYRLTQPLPISFPGTESFALGNNAWCPFNTQSTLFFAPAFPLLYLPITCNARVTDIWKSFVAQRIAWANDWHVLFTPSTVYQERNEHDLMKDFTMEIDNFLQNEKIGLALQGLNLNAGVANIPDNMLVCYEKLIEMQLIQQEEIQLLQDWFADIEMFSAVSKHSQGVVA